MTNLIGLASEPYYTNPHGYEGKHRNDDEQARADGIHDDYHWLKSQRGACHYSCAHYQPRHNPFVPREVAA